MAKLSKHIQQYQNKLKELGIDWKPPTSKEIACSHQWDKPYRTGETRVCTKCGGKQTN